MYTLKATDSDFKGNSGDMSMAIWEENGKIEFQHDATPRVGVVIRVGSLYARSFSSQDWWETSPIVEILKEKENYVKFKTTSGTIYEWCWD